MVEFSVFNTDSFPKCAARDCFVDQTTIREYVDSTLTVAYNNQITKQTTAKTVIICLQSYICTCIVYVRRHTLYFVYKLDNVLSQDFFALVRIARESRK